jgi:arsenate reductase (glutaredoxin)
MLVLSYAGCSTCKKALQWLEGRKLSPKVRPIVDQPPTLKELGEWIPRSGLPVRKWLNTSGLSYRALGKAKIDAASDETLRAWLAKDGKLVKRPVLITDDAVLVGFREEEWAKALR